MRRELTVMLLALSALPLSAQSRPQPTLRPIATLAGVGADDIAVMPNGRIMYYVSGDSLYAHEIAAKRSTLVATGEFDDLSVAPRGNRIVFDRENEAGTVRQIWSMQVDSVTGKALATAQRVSTKQGHEGRISPDGKTIAFISPIDSSRELVVVPVAGGPERLLATFPDPLGVVEWSIDGASVFAATPASGAKPSNVMRISLANGATQVLHTAAAASGHSAVFDGELSIFRGAKQSGSEYSVRLADGSVAPFTQPAGSWAREDRVGSAMRHFVVSTSRARRSYLLNLQDGQLRPVPAPPGSEGSTSSSPSGAYSAQSLGNSPDGRLLALQTSVNGKSSISVFDLTTSRTRSYAVPFGLPDAILTARWSADSRKLAFVAERTKMVWLDVTTGQTSVLHASSRPLFAMVWTNDGAAVRFWQMEANGTRAIYEVNLGGTLRKLHELPADMNRRGMFATADLFEYGTDQGEFVQSMSGGAARRLPVESRPVNGAPSGFGAWWTFLLSADRGSRGRVQVTNLAGDSSRVVDLPFEAVRSTMPTYALAPSHRELYMLGRPLGEQAPRLYAVPLDGRAPREIARLSSDEPPFQLALSRDGRTIIYTVQSPPTTTVQELDFGPLVGGTAKD